MVIHSADKGETKAINYREKAPMRGHRDMFLDTDGSVDRDLATAGYQAVGIPGTVAGLLWL